MSIPEVSERGLYLCCNNQSDFSLLELHKKRVLNRNILNMYMGVTEAFLYVVLWSKILHLWFIFSAVFDDGDEKTLRRSSLCLKGARHFAESEVCVCVYIIYIHWSAVTLHPLTDEVNNITLWDRQQVNSQFLKL